MVRTARLAIVLLLVFAGAQEPLAASHPSAEASPTLYREVVEASGVGEASNAEAEATRLELAVADLAARTGAGGSPYGRAKRMHRLLHDRVLRRYRAEADGVLAALDSGEFNCVSAALLEGLVARELGFDVQVVEGPRHVLLRIGISGRFVEVEATQAEGFDRRRHPERMRAFLLAYKLATPGELQGGGLDLAVDAQLELRAPVDLETGVAFAWLNAGLRALERGDPEAARRPLERAKALHPDLLARADGVRSALASVFRRAYDDGRIEDAYGAARLDLDLFPGRVSAEDRLLAAASRRIDVLTSTGDLAGASAFLRGFVEAYPTLAPQLERSAYPLVAGAAVRVADWERALEAAARFAAVAPDPAEGRRLLGWVESRRGDRDPPPKRASPKLQ